MSSNNYYYKYEDVNSVVTKSAYKSRQLDFKIDPNNPEKNLNSFTPNLSINKTNGLIRVQGIYKANAWQLSLDGGKLWAIIDPSIKEYLLSPGQYSEKQIAIRSLLLPDYIYSAIVYNKETLTIRPDRPNVVFNKDGDGYIRVLVNNKPSSSSLWAYSIDNGDTWSTLEINNDVKLPPGKYTYRNLKVKTITRDGVSSPEPHVTPSVNFQVRPENPTVVYNINDYSYTIKSLANDTVNWSYSIDNGKNWSDDYTLKERNSFTLPTGTYPINSIIIQNKTRDDVSDYPILYMNQKIEIINRPGAPAVGFAYKQGIIVSKLGEGASKWRYSLNSGETWSEYLYKPLTIYPPLNYYIAGSIYVKSYSDDGTSHRNPIVNNLFYIPGRSVSKYGDVINVPSQVAFDKSDAEKHYDNEVETNNDIIRWPSSVTKNLTVDLSNSTYNKWQYSIRMNETDARKWITPETSTVTIPPGYYNVFRIAIKLIKHKTDEHPETFLTMFNYNDIVIYPVPPKISYIEKGIFVVKLLDGATSWEYKVSDQSTWTTGYGSTLLLPPGVYARGFIMIRSIVDSGAVMSPFIINQSSIDVIDNKYHTNEIPGQTWQIDTILTKNAYINDMLLEVFSNVGFGEKKAIIIGYGDESETRIVTKLGSLAIDRPLTKNYPEGTLIRGFDIELIDSLSLAEKAYGLTYAASNLRSSSNRVKCMSYIFSPDTATIDTCIVGNETKHMLGEGIGTKINKINNIMKAKRGKIVYGDNGLSSPFLPSDTIEDTNVSVFYRCNIPNDIPIINGLRGGIVPVNMRTNKF